MVRSRQLRRVRREHCKRCELYRSTVNRCVMGRGDPYSRLVLIGEAPGRMESETGKPFMGRAGKLLDAMLTEIDLEQPYITNFCKCRPPENRTPTFPEIKRCYKYLRQELDIITPDVVLILGKTIARKAKFSKEQLSGKTFTWYSARARVTVHPAYVLRNPSERKTLMAALRWARKEMKR